MPAFADLTGQVFGRLQVLGRALNRGRLTVWKCRCLCGASRFVAGTSSLTSGNTRSCGCLQREKASATFKRVAASNVIDLAGRSFGRLVVIGRSPTHEKRKSVTWCCRCSCGARTTVSGVHLRKNFVRSCGCLQREAASAVGRSRVGAKHPNWRGGLTPASQRIRASDQYRTWRKTVFERDKYTCQFCGKKGGPLHADHIKPFADYPTLRFAAENGRTLCVPCHRKTPTYGGRRSTR